MITGRLERGLEAAWGRDDPGIAHRSAWPIWAGTGAETTSTVYFEIDAGKRIGAHTHDADETIALLQGSGRGRVGDEAIDVSPGMVVHVPQGSLHDFINTGSEMMKLIGFFSKAEVTSTYQDVLLPEGTTESGTP